MRALCVLWNDYLVLAVLAILRLGLNAGPIPVESIDQVVNYCIQAEQNATSACNAKGKSMSRYILHRFIVHVFVDHASAKENLALVLVLSISCSLFLSQKGNMFLYSQPNPYIFNANIIESKLNLASCTVCGAAFTAANRSKAMVCYTCGVHMHVECAINSKRMLSVKSSGPTEVFMCSDCVNQSVNSIQMMLLRNALVAMNYVIMIDSVSHLPRMFQRDILILASKIHPERKEFYRKTEADIFTPFFAKPGNVVLDRSRDICSWCPSN